MYAPQIRGTPVAGIPSASSDVAHRGPEEQQLQLVEDLRAQVMELEYKLGALHGSDIHSLRRAYHSLTQHIQALDIESKHITNVIDGLETSVVTPAFVAEEVSVVACITASAWSLDRLVRALKLANSGPLANAISIAGICLAGWRLAFTTGRRIVGVMGKNRRIKRQLHDDWLVVAQRINVMSELARADLARVQMAQQAAAGGAQGLPPYPPPPPVTQYVAQFGQ